MRRYLYVAFDEFPLISLSICVFQDFRKNKKLFDVVADAAAVIHSHFIAAQARTFKRVPPLVREKKKLKLNERYGLRVKILDPLRPMLTEP